MYLSRPADLLIVAVEKIASSVARLGQLVARADHMSDHPMYSGLEGCIL